MPSTKVICILLVFFSHNLAAQMNSDTIITSELPDTFLITNFTDFAGYSFAYTPGQIFDPDTLMLYHDTVFITSISLPKSSVATINEYVTTTLHNGSGYEINNGFGVNSEFGYYLKQNDDGSIQLNDWNQTISGDSITTNSFGNQVPVEFTVITEGQTDFLDPSIDASLGETEVYVNGIRLFSNEFTIDPSFTGINTTIGLSIGEKVIIDID